MSRPNLIITRIAPALIAFSIFFIILLQVWKNLMFSSTGTQKDLDTRISLTKPDVSIFTPTKHLISKTSTIEREGPSTFLENGGIIGFRDRKRLILCALGINPTCQSKYIADSIDLILSFNPVYAVYQGTQGKRYETHFNFLNYLKTIGIRYQVTEAIMPHRGQTFKATSAGNEPWEMQLNITNPFYYRENLVNVAARKTKDLWEYLLMIDGHQYFDNLYWWEETVWKCEHYTGVQLFKSGIHIDLKNKTVPYYTQPAVAYLYAVRADLRDQTRYSGNAWAIRKEVYNEIDYIIDYCIVGGCDGSYFLATIKENDTRRELTEPQILNFHNYFKEFDEWIWNASKGFKGQDTFIRGNMIHFYHEEFFSYLGLMRKINAKSLFSNHRDFTRDVNYTLMLKNETMATMIDEYFFGKDVNNKLDSVAVIASRLIFNIYMAVIRFIAKAVFGYKI